MGAIFPGQAGANNRKQWERMCIVHDCGSNYIVRRTVLYSTVKTTHKKEIWPYSGYRLQHSNQSKLRIWWMTLLEQRQQKAIDSLTDEQFTKWTHAKAEKRFDLLTKEHKAIFLYTKLIRNFIQDRKIKQKIPRCVP